MDQTNPLEIISSSPPAWRAQLTAALAAGGVSAQTQAGLCEFRRAALHAERAVEALNDAIAWEANAGVRALLENARIAALYLLVRAAHVAAGHDIRPHAKTITRYADHYGKFKGDAEA